ncbi:WapI family immunity protein [Spirosoma fluminis]
MLLIGQRSFFELNILDYEHAPDATVSSDRNLLWVAVRSGWQHHQSTSTAAILHTYEIDVLLGWLRHLYATGRPQSRLLFSEPCLSFECLSADSDEFLLQIKLAFEIAPDWHTDPFSPFWLPVVISKRKLAEAIDQLVDQFLNFPVRR